MTPPETAARVLVKPPARSHLTNGQKVAIAAVGIVLNIAAGTVVRGLGLPVYVDATGTIVVTLMLGLRWGAGTGVLSFLLWSTMIGVVHYFVLTQVAIAAFVGFVASKGWLEDIWKQIISGVSLGVVTLLASAPVILLVFGDESTGTGRAETLDALLAVTGSRLGAIMWSGAPSELVDKTLVLMLAIWLIVSLPGKFVRGWQETSYLRLNELDCP